MKLSSWQSVAKDDGIMEFQRPS